MYRLNLLLFLRTLVPGGVKTDEVRACARAPNCPLLPDQTTGRVSLQDLNKVLSKHWIMIYYSEFDNEQNYGKCSYRWTTTGSVHNAFKNVECFYKKRQTCQDSSEMVKRMTDECGRATEHSMTNEPMDGKFFSQNLEQYLWYYSCYAYNVTKQCTQPFLDLLVSKNRYPDSEKSELNVFGLPWHLIVSDLKNHFNMDLSDPKMKFAWTGPECDFDGNIIERSSCTAVQRDFIAMSITFILHFSTMFIYH